MLLALKRIYAITRHLISGASYPPSRLVSFPLPLTPFLTSGYMETWMTSQCGSAARGEVIRVFWVNKAASGICRLQQEPTPAMRDGSHAE